MYQKNYFNFKRMGSKFLLTNDFGNYIFLPENVFETLIKNEELPKKIKNELINKQFVFCEEKDKFVEYHYQKLKEYKSYIDEGTTLHIFVVSKNCNYNCIYCQAGNLNQKDDFLMSEETAKKAVDIAFESPSQFLTFEFQGGEPLINFVIIKYVVEYSKQKNLQLNKRKEIEFQIVSNLSLLTEDMIPFLKENDIAICTSIDGNRELQNKNRPYAKKDSYEATVENYKLLQQNGVNVSALLTTTKHSLQKWKSIVDEYIKLGFDSIYIRPLTKLGKAKECWDNIGYTPEEFIDFYRKTLDYIIEKNKKGILLSEGIASILLRKILKGESVNYMELRSPCGGAIGQLAYYYDGNIYTCDEGRMLAEMGDKTFLLGNVFDNCYKELISHECTKKMCMASCVESSMQCHSCVYMPYCGTCPVVNYSNTNEMSLTCRDDFRCKIMKGTLDTLFDYINKEKKEYIILKSWIGG